MVLLHRDCELYRRKFFPDTKLRLADVLTLWPRLPHAVTFPAKYHIATAENSFKSQFIELVMHPPYIQGKDPYDDTNDTSENFKSILQSLAKLPAELVVQIAGWSYSQTLQQLAVILKEGRLMEDYVKQGAKGITHFVDYTGEAVSFQHLYVCGTRYVAGLNFEAQNSEIRYPLQAIMIIRDEVGVTGMDFDGEFAQAQSRSWYKFIQPERRCAVLLVQIEVSSPLRTTQRANRSSTLSQTLVSCTTRKSIGTVPLQLSPMFPLGLQSKMALAYQY